MMLQIKKAQKSDCSLILDFIQALAKYEKLEHEVIADIAKLERTLFVENIGTEVFLGYENSTPVGFALIFPNYSTFLAKPGIYLEDLFIKEEYRGKGYGKEMLRFLAKLALKRNCGRLEWSVLDWNKPAIDFYQSIGALAMKEWFGFRLSKKALTQLANFK